MLLPGSWQSAGKRDVHAPPRVRHARDQRLVDILHEVQRVDLVNHVARIAADGLAFDVDLEAVLPHDVVEVALTLEVHEGHVPAMLGEVSSNSELVLEPARISGKTQAVPERSNQPRTGFAR